MSTEHHKSTSSFDKSYTYDLDSIDDLNKFKGFKLISLNIRSLLPKINLLRLDMVNTDVDVFTLNETWLKPTVSDGLLKLKEYGFVRSDRTTVNQNGDLKAGGGLGIYYKLDYVCSEIGTLRCCTDDLECFVITLTRSLHFKAIIINFYRPPAGSIQSAIDYLGFVLDYLSTDYDKFDVYMTGDLNLNLLSCNNYTKMFMELCAQHSIYNLVNRPTRITPQNATLLDICATSTNNINAAGVIKYRISDQFMTFCCKKKNRNDKGIERVKTMVGSFKDYDSSAMSTSLRNYNWGRFYGTQDVNEAWKIMFNQLLIHANFYAPYVSATLDKINLAGIVLSFWIWLSREIIYLSKQIRVRIKMSIDLLDVKVMN